MRILLDTDIGGDFDDANALALLAGLCDMEIVAVTTIGAGGDAVKRGRLASYILQLGGRSEVPVHAGIDRPMVRNPVLEALAPNMILNGYDESMAGAKLSSHHAVDAIVDLAAEFGAELTLLCTGALTNVAAAIKKSERTMKGIGRLVMMGGAYRTQYREANVAIDPESADIVLRSGIPITAIGFEEARRLVLPLSAYAHEPFVTSRLGALYASMARRYAKAYRTDSTVLYDVTATVAAVRPQWFAFEELRVAVELHGEWTRGMTVVEQDHLFNAVPHGSWLTVARDHDAEAVLDLFTETVLQATWPAAG